VTVSSFQSPTVTEDILAPANLHKQVKENAVLILLDLIDIAELWLRAQLRGVGGHDVEGPCFLHVHRMWSFILAFSLV
jgi:hypothetical protein